MKKKHIWKRLLTSVIALAMVFTAMPVCSGGYVFATETSADEANRTETEAETEAEEETKPKTETETESKTETEVETEAETETKTESGSEAATETEGKPETVTVTESEETSADITDSERKSYTVTLKQAEGGTLTLKNADGRLVEENVYSYEEGETITVVIEDSEFLGFRLVMETSEGEVFADSWEDEYTACFTMPAEDVVISVTYHEQTEEEKAQAEKDEEMLKEEEESSGISLFSTSESISLLSSDSDYATYKKGKLIYYAGYNTRYRTSDGNEAYCLQPEYNGPANGTYLKRYDIEDYITSLSGASEELKAELLRIAAYYSYGCPGFDKSMWPDTWYDGTAMTAERYYVLAHILLAELYTGSTSAALDGTVSAFQTYYRNYVGGYANGEKVNNFDDTTRGKVNAVYHSGSVTDAFVIYLLINSGLQDILGWEYAETGGVRVYKEPEDEEVYEDNDYYSLEGAVYGIYESRSDAASDTNRKETLTTTSTGKSNIVEELVEGTYYVKEVSASEGFDLDTATYTIEVTKGKTTKVKSIEPMHTGKITVTKTANDVGVLNVSTTVKGAVYGIYDDDGNLVEEITTNSSGTATSGKLYFGDYTVKEISAPDGYWVDDKEYDVSVKEEKTYTVSSTDKVAYGYIEIYKYSDNPDVTDINSCYSYAGAQYGIYDSGGNLVQTLTTVESSNGKYGYARSDKLATGTYTVKEITESTGFDLDTKTYSVDVTAGSTSTTTYVKSVKSTEPGWYEPLTLTLTKIDSETGESVPEGDASLAGAQFTIRYYDTTAYATADALNAAIKSGKLEESDAWRTWVIETKAETNASGVTKYVASLDDSHLVSGSDELYYDEETGAPILPLGAIVVEETSAPEGYLADGMSYTDGNGNVTKGTVYFSRIMPGDETAKLTGGNEYSISEVVKTGGVKIKKRDCETGDDSPEGNATLEGAVFNIVNKSEEAVVVNGKSCEPGEVVMTITTDEDGLATTAANDLPYGSYELVEVEAPEGYLDEGVTSQPFTIEKDGVIVDLTAEPDSIQNYVKRGGVKIQKRDLQSGDMLAEGGATLGGAVFTITNVSEYAVLVDGNLYDPGEVVATLVTDDSGYASTASDTLPYGTYRIDESEEPSGYLQEGVLSRTFEIREEGVIVDMTGEQDSILNRVKRGDFTFTKADEGSQERLANCKFSVTSNTTGESHIIWTDANGYYSSESEFYAHSDRTNSGEPGSGIWFGLNEEGENVAVDDDMGALPYDTYTVQELACDANEGLTLVSFTVVISRDGYVVEMGTVSDPTVAISTSVIDEDNGTHYAVAGEETILVDTVNYTGLVKGKTYTLVTKLMDKDTCTVITDADGDEIAVTTEFTASMKTGSEDVEIIFDSAKLAGHTVVVYEYLYDSSDELIASHVDIADAKQTIYFPGIGTTAADADTGIDVSYADEDVTIIDVVEYSNVKSGRTYTVNGTLYNRETGEPLTDAGGNTITAATSFKAAESSGTVTLSFTFDGSLLAGTSVVAFETLERNNVIYAAHEDISDEGQTVHFPNVGTTASDSETNENASYADDSITIYDLVSYENIDTGYEYTVTGTVYDAETGEKLLINGQEITETRTLSSEESSGTMRMTFSFDGTGLEGRTLVVYEDVYYNGMLVASHEDPTDTDQQILIPKIETTVKDNETGTNVTYAYGDVTVIDTVTYENLLTDREYTMAGTLYDQETGEAVTDDDGTEVTASTTFTPAESSGTVEVIFTFPGVKLAGTAAVAFETLEQNGHTYATHTDIKDETQTEYFPVISTSMTDSGTADHIAKADEKATLIDTVTYTGLPIGQEFTVTGVLMDAETGEAVPDADGNEVKASTTFTTTGHDGTVDVIYTFDALALAGHSVVSFETLTVNSKDVAKHEDITDKGQTVIFPEVHTNASDLTSGTDVTNSDGDVIIEDVVTYENVLAGKEYTITGILIDKATGEYFLDDNGEVVTAAATFTAEETGGSVTLEFTVSAKSLGSQTLVAFESLTYKGVEVGSHAEIADADQTVYLPKIGTTAIDSDTRIHVSCADDTVTVVDTVAYADLSPNHTYTVTGTLMDADTKETLEVNGKKVTASTEFTPESTDGTIDVTFTFDASGLAGSTLVVFEHLYLGDYLVTGHTDFADEKQFDYIPKISTTASDSETKDHISYADDKVTINDVVAYTDLQPGAGYTVKGTLYDKETGKSLTIGDKTVTASTEFTAEAADGEVTVTFVFDGTGLENKTLVAYEYLYYNDILIAEHEDIEDEDQVIYIPKIGTTATEKRTGNKTVSAGKVTVVDTIAYENLIPGLEYTAFGTVMNRETGNAVEVNGEKVTAEVTFTPEESKGTVDVEFIFDASELGGATVVWYEDLYYDGTKIAAHSDINDSNQSIDVENIVKKSVKKLVENPVKNHPATGDYSRMFLLAAAFLAAAMLLVAAIKKRGKKQKSSDEV